MHTARSGQNLARTGVWQMDEKQVGRRIRALRRRAGLSQERIAALSGVSRPAIGRLENGEGSTLSTYLAVMTTLRDRFPESRDRDGKGRVGHYASA